MIIDHGQCPLDTFSDSIFKCLFLLIADLFAHSYKPAIFLVSTGRINLKNFITHCFALEQALDAFETARSGEAIKVIIDCERK